MLEQRNFAYYATIPVNLALIVWVWIGRALFGSGGWWILIFLVSVVPALIVALTVTTVLAVLQHQPKSSGRLTVPQFWALLGVWVSLFGFGLFIVDFGDSTDSYSSAFSQLFGRWRHRCVERAVRGVLRAVDLRLGSTAGAADRGDAGARGAEGVRTVASG